MIYNNIWISNIENIEELHRIIRKTPKILMPFLGVLTIGKNFPYTKIFHMKFPIIFESFGTLRIIDSKIQFTAQKISGKHNLTYHNLRQEDFELPIDAITKIDSYQSQKTYFGSRNFPWVLLELKNGGNLLISSEIRPSDFEDGIATNEHISKTIRNFIVLSR